MEIEIRLFGILRNYLPRGRGSSFKKVLEQAVTVKDIIEELGLPDNIHKVIVVNGTHPKEDYVLQGGDVLSIFPPLAGG